jgi:hypothetical protein
MTRVGKLTAGTIGALSAAALAIPAAQASAQTSVPVVACPTAFGIPSEARQPPRTISVLGSPASTRGLVAYTNTFDYLIGPAGMRCSGAVGVDGGQRVVVWAASHGMPGPRSRDAGVSLLIDPACLSCKAADACPFFAQFSAAYGTGCPTGIPPGERVYGLRRTITLFEDPPGIAGDGWPSGGSNPANGLVGLNTTVRQNPLVYRSTCTLPATQHWICSVSLNDTIARVGGHS